MKSDARQLGTVDGPIRVTRAGTVYHLEGSLRMGALIEWLAVHLLWCARQDSNLRPLAPEANALSS